MNFDLDGYLVHMLDAIEARPRMWAGEREALSATYVGALDVLRIVRGWNPHEAKRADLTFNRWILVQTTDEGPNNIPIWARKGHEDMTHADVVVLLKKLRAEVLG